MNAQKSAIVCLMLVALLFAGCGGSDAAEMDAAGEGGAQASAQASPDDMTPEEIGERIGEIYAEGMTTVTDKMESRPEPEALRADLEQLKEEMVTELVALGRARQDMDAADQATINGQARMGLSSVSRDTFTAYSEGLSHYRNIDRDLGELIASFNIITQYADFGLLKKQDPEEAERLGID